MKIIGSNLVHILTELILEMYSILIVKISTLTLHVHTMYA